MSAAGQHRIFHAKTKGADGQWAFRGTVVLRNDGRGGVLYWRTGQKDADGKDLQEVIALFAKRERPAGAEVPAAAAA